MRYPGSIMAAALVVVLAAATGCSGRRGSGGPGGGGSGGEGDVELDAGGLADSGGGAGDGGAGDAGGGTAGGRSFFVGTISDGDGSERVDNATRQPRPGEFGARIARQVVTLWLMPEIGVRIDLVADTKDRWLPERMAIGGQGAGKPVTGELVDEAMATTFAATGGVLYLDSCLDSVGDRLAGRLEEATFVRSAGGGTRIVSGSFVVYVVEAKDPAVECEMVVGEDGGVAEDGGGQTESCLSAAGCAEWSTGSCCPYQYCLTQECGSEYCEAECAGEDEAACLDCCVRVCMVDEGCHQDLSAYGSCTQSCAEAEDPLDCREKLCCETMRKAYCNCSVD